MHFHAFLALLSAVQLVWAHGDDHVPGETVQQYAQRHMTTEHHIDSFDAPSFFQLHDLNRDGLWDREEIEAVYGVHHFYSRKQSADGEEHQKKADHIVNTVLALLDKNGDGKISLKELSAVGLDGLPNFEDLGAEGHHYDVESEFFLHHEEQYHSTPETQTDEAYTHPEDIEHFAHHEEIEKQEAEREAKFQGISVDEALKQHEEPPAEQHQEQEQQQQEQPQEGDHNFGGEGSPESMAQAYADAQQYIDPVLRMRAAKASASGKPSTGFNPRSPGDRVNRRTAPYKYKFRRAFGDF